MKEPREFSCFDNYQDGWGNSILDEPRYRKYPEDDEEEDMDGIREINFWANFNEETVTVVNRGGNFNFQND